MQSTLEQPISLESEAQLQERLAERVVAMESVVPCEIIEDAAGRLRPEFVVHDGVSMTFRGREETPTLPEQQASTVDVLTEDERPVYNSATNFESWLHQKDEVDPGEDTFEQGLKSDSEKITVIASSSPLGVVDAALKLNELGFGDTEKQDELYALREKVVSKECDEEVFELFDSIYAAGAVDSDTGKLCASASADGPMIAALALAGEATAKDVLSTKEDILALYDERCLTELYGEIRETRLKEPGEKLTEVELAEIEEAGLVAVHTTQGMPVVEADGTRTIHPTGDYTIGSDSHFPRASIHWSLNHPVVSHLGGNFKGRPVTIVEPLVDLAKENGAPAVLNVVDTYFDQNPEQGLKVSETAVIIEMHQNTDTPFIVRDGQNIRIRSVNMSSADLQQFADYEHELYLQGKPEYMQGSPTPSEDAAKALAHSITHESGLPLTITGHRLTDLIENPDEQYMSEEAKLFHGLVKDRQNTAPDESITESVEAIMLDLIQGNLSAEEHPELHKMLLETIRQMAVKGAIREAGGTVIAANEERTGNLDFDDQVTALRTSLGLRGALHTHESEGWAEDQFKSALSESKDGSGEDRHFNGEKFDDSIIWAAMANLPFKARRHIMRTGVLSFTPKKKSPFSQSPLGI